MTKTSPYQETRKRRLKKIIKKRASKLTPGITYAWGCRGHPGLVIERRYWPNWSLPDLFGSDVTIRSLVDGVEESCSVYYCNPQPIDKDDALAQCEKIKTTHDFDLSAENGYPVEELKKWCQEWVNEGCIYYVLYDKDGFTVRSAAVKNHEDAEEEIERLKRYPDLLNPRKVDMLTYPVPIQSFTLDRPIGEVSHGTLQRD